MTAAVIDGTPIIGMTVMPGYCDGDPLMVGAFAACVRASLSQPEVLAAFKKETGIDMQRVIGPRSPIVAAVDKATGFEGSSFAKFADWIAINVWGTDEDETP